MEHQRPTLCFEPKRRWTWVLLVLLFLFHLIAPSRAWVALLAAVGGAVAFGYLWARQLAGRLTITRQQYYGWVHVGDLLEERFNLNNRSFLPALWVEIDDQSDLPGYSARSVRSADGHQTIRWRTEGVCRQRGLFTLGPWQARLGDPFGFFSVTLDYQQTNSIIIYPPVVHLPTLTLPKGVAPGAGRTSRSTLEVTTNASGVRGYLPGDTLNRIHWRSSARMDQLMAKTFDLEPSGDLWIILDMDSSVQAGADEESTEEYGVILASSLADRALRENRAVGLAAYGVKSAVGQEVLRPHPTLVLPDKGSTQRWRILQALALVRAGGNWPLSRVLAEMDRNLGRGSTLVVITPSCRFDWLDGLLPPMRRGVAPVVVLLDPVSFGGEGQAEELRGVLADLGVASHLIAKGMPFRPVVEQPRSGRPELKVLPGTGRVVPVLE
jgi:uncharacterized protein (DUF58 family)